MKYVLILLLLNIAIQSKSATIKLIVKPTCTEFVYSISDDILMLARLIYAEARGEPYLGKLGVGQVVRNRMQYTSRSLRAVIYRKGQFDGINTRAFYQTPSEECILAAIEILENNISVFGDRVLYFLNPKVSTDVGFMTRIAPYFVVKIGRHNFYEKK